MTRRFILTTATLAAFLAAGTPLAAAPSPERRSERVAARERTLPDLPPLLAIGDDLLAVYTAGSAASGDTLGVALFIEAGLDPGDLSLWAGLKQPAAPSRCPAPAACWSPASPFPRPCQPSPGCGSVPVAARARSACRRLEPTQLSEIGSPATLNGTVTCSRRLQKRSSRPASSGISLL